MRTLLIAEHVNSALKDATARALTAALMLGHPVDVLVAGQSAGPAADAAAKLQGVAKVLRADAASLANQLAEPMAALIVDIAEGYSTIVGPATSSAKNILPRVAALLDVAQISEVTRIVGPKVFERPIYAGNALQTVESMDAKVVLTVRGSAFRAAPTGGSAPIEVVAWRDDEGRSRFLSEALSRADRPELSSARIVVSGGRGLGSAENFANLIEPLATKLGAAIGASRAAVDAGYAPNDLQVGQTGKAVAPDLYVACGISGAIQHLAGMKESRVIVAINKDADAPIFAIADYGLVGDLFEILPQLERALK